MHMYIEREETPIQNACVHTHRATYSTYTYARTYTITDTHIPRSWCRKVADDREVAEFTPDAQHRHHTDPWRGDGALVRGCADDLWLANLRGA